MENREKPTNLQNDNYPTGRKQLRELRQQNTGLRMMITALPRFKTVITYVTVVH